MLNAADAATSINHTVSVPDLPTERRNKIPLMTKAAVFQIDQQEKAVYALYTGIVTTILTTAMMH